MSKPQKNDGKWLKMLLLCVFRQCLSSLTKGLIDFLMLALVEQLVVALNCLLVFDYLQTVHSEVRCAWQYRNELEEKNSLIQ